MKFDYSNLKEKIKKHFNNQTKLADALGVSRASLNMKINNKSYFTQQEILMICDLLNISQEEIPVYFFRLKKEVIITDE